MEEKVQAALKYLEKKIGAKLFVLPIEKFQNSIDSGVGVRILIQGTKKSFRLNWHGGVSGLANVSSIDVWDGTSHDPVANIHIGGNVRGLIKALPEIAEIIKQPTIGEADVIVTEGRTQLGMLLDEQLVTEAARKWTPETIVDAALRFIDSNPSKISKMAFASGVGYNNAGVIDIIFEMYPDSFEKQGKSTVLVKKTAFDREAILKQVEDRSVRIEVVSGGKNETYGGGDEAEEANINRVPFIKQAQHIRQLVKGVAKGAFNSLIITGKGGTGKTQNVEDQLAELGLSDGNGYFKQTGSSSAIGVYATLYQNRTGLVLFDDCDGALADQDARNLIKAATDTKKQRKMSWGKRSSMMYDPDTEEVDEEDDGVEKFPRYFFFEGRIIFISNLSTSKLDPDGAIRSRSFVVSVNPSKQEMIEYMETILGSMAKNAGLSLEQAKQVYENVKTLEDPTPRVLSRAMSIAASGIDNWEELTRLYA